jgi:blue copper oxidase
MNQAYNKLKEIVTVAFTTVTTFLFAQNPLFIPPTISGTNFVLNVQADSTEFFPGHKTPTYGVNGNILGPTLILNKGDNVTLNVTNNLPTTTTMHWHGLHVPAMADGGPHQIITQGNTWSPSFTVMNDAGTYWYHPHGQNKTDIQVSKGLAGLIIVKDSTEAALTLPRTYGVDDFPIIVQTKCFDVLYQTAIATVFDTVPMVNATINAEMNAPAQIIRLRLLDGSSDRSYLFGFSNNMNFYQIATDGGLLQTPVMINRMRLSPGERAEVLVDLSSMQGQTVQLMNFGSQLPNGIIGAQTVGMGMSQIPDYNQNFLNGADFSLLQMNVVAPTSNPVTTIPSALVPLQPLDTNLIHRTRNIVFAPQTMGPIEMVEGPFTMNGHQFSMDTINDTTYLNHIEKWTLTNQTLIAHPFHIHDVQFFIADINGGPVPPTEQGKKDVVLVMPQQTVSFVTKFEDFTDTIPYMYHCHLLHHEDDGMMGSFVVLPSPSGIEDKFTGSIVRYYPNPVSGALSIETTGFDSEIIYLLHDELSRCILSGTADNNSGKLEINLGHIRPGIYTMHISGNKKSAHCKIIKL